MSAPLPPTPRAPDRAALSSQARWVLAGCTVSPAFEFEGFELAPAGWRPEGWSQTTW